MHDFDGLAGHRLERYFHKRHAQPVKAELANSLFVSYQFCGVLFKADAMDAHSLICNVKVAAGRDQHRALKAGGIRAVDNQLAHDVYFVHHLGVER